MMYCSLNVARLTTDVQLYEIVLVDPGTPFQQLVRRSSTATAPHFSKQEYYYVQDNKKLRLTTNHVRTSRKNHQKQQRHNNALGECSTRYQTNLTRPTKLPTLHRDNKQKAGFCTVNRTNLKIKPPHAFRCSS